MRAGLLILGSQTPVTDRMATFGPPAWDGRDTWGMSGSSFGQAFAAALVVTTVVAWLLRWRLDSRRSWSLGSADNLRTEELAWLANGEVLVTVSVFWCLWRRDVLSFDNAELAGVLSGHRSVDAALLESSRYARASRATSVSLGWRGRAACETDLERAAVDLVAEKGSLRPDVLARSLRRSEAMADLKASLHRCGFARPKAVQTRMTIGVAAVFAPLLLVGTARLGVGLVQSEPMGPLLVLLIASFGLFLAMVLVTERPATTDHLLRRACRRQVQRQAVALTSLAGPEPTIDEGRAIALLGAGVLWHANPLGAATIQAPTVMLIAGYRLSMDDRLRVGGAVAPQVGP